MSVSISILGVEIVMDCSSGSSRAIFCSGSHKALLLKVGNTVLRSFGVNFL